MPETSVAGLETASMDGGEGRLTKGCDCSRRPKGAIETPFNADYKTPSSLSPKRKVHTFYTAMEGQCLCGAVKVKVNDDNLFGSQRRGHLCHCSQCRKVAGGLFGANLTIETEKVEISGEENLTKYDDPETLSGTPMSRYFCKTCGA
jgi:hypothetical protein